MNKEKKEISVIVPIYNAEKYIRRCIESIVAQSFRNYELVLVDDGSIDDCGMICDEYANEYDFIKVIHQDNSGQAAARNNAIKIAKGEFICFVDADDVIHPQMLETLYSNLSNTSTCISVCGTIEDDHISFPDYKIKRNNYEIYFPDEESLMKLYDKSYVCWTVWAKLIPKSIIDKYPFEENRVFEDNAIVIKWLCSAEKISYISDPLYFYQINPEGTTKSNWTEKKAFDHIWAREEQLLFLKERNMNKFFDLVLSKYLYDLAHDFYSKKERYPYYAQEIRRISLRWWKHYSKRLNLEKTQKQYIYGMINPFGEAVYEWLKNHTNSRGEK